MRMCVDVLVLGAGVSGLTTAVCLAEAGLAVTLRSRDRPGETTSCAAGAIWGPYLVDDERVTAWAEQTRSVLEGLARTGRSTGVRLCHGMEAARAPVGPPAWARALPDFRCGDPAELPEGFASGWWYTAPVVDMPTYVAYLQDRFSRAGGVIEIRPVESLRDAAALAPVTVNCTGFWARDLVPDPAVSPTRGQVVVVDNPGINTFFVQYDESPQSTYFLPHGDHLVLGGNAEPGSDQLTPDLAVAAAIQRRCAAVEPSIATARVRAHRVGLRPSRAAVRLEATVVDGGRYLIHNYGHGGAGVTLSWGCANEVLGLVSALLTTRA